MAHVELSLTEAFVPAPATSTHESDSFSRWVGTVSAAAEPCLVIDVHTIVSAVSRSCCTLLGLGSPAEAVGRPLLDNGLRLLDFTAARAELSEQEAEKIPPLLAISSQRLARGLMRVATPAVGDPDATVDAIAAPLLAADGSVAGSLTFLSEV
ncbi:hypothetical protein [Plantactinospora sp. KBS50]|uniref:hypothetical protein n=1 Tax=Plantactinospora sp. KBS50 TaxID=2024580 RepID=UPI000BAADD52|nr:hypothetical protein [Plantactinospora sp. KBS50]ASW57250.1 hypothetical protein CIK06_28570 [Plantactinospora sp. KBS50]